jgi:hypothetical protein
MGTNLTTTTKSSKLSHFKEIIMSLDLDSMSYSDSEVIQERFELREILGEGTYGVVYKAKDLRDGQIKALKKI